MNPVRLNKYLAQSGISSRRKAEEYILSGRVLVNEKIVTDLAFKVDAEKDVVRLDGEKISPRKNIYILLNKPRGVVSTVSDEKKRMTVVDLIKIPHGIEKIFPVGRLDYDTTGVLFLTNDGDFSNLLSHPRNKVPRVYEARLDRALEEHDKEKLLSGITLKSDPGRRARFIKIFFLKKDRKSVEVTCIEGRNHFVKNLFGALGYRVINLDRKIFAGIHTDIKPGEFRYLSNTEVDKLKKIYGR